jgi:hypothetical protein
MAEVQSVEEEAADAAAQEEKEGEQSGGIDFEFDINSFVEQNKMDLDEELEEEEPEEAQEEEESSSSSSGEGAKSSKQKVNECKMFVDFFDMGMSFVLTMTAGDPPNQRESYCAEESYKTQMAEQMALCEWTPKLKPEYMLVFIALLAYGPAMVTAWKKRTAREKIKKDREKKGQDVGPIIHMVENPHTGEWEEVDENGFAEQKASKANPDVEVKGGGNSMKICGVCGAPHKNKKYCSKECNLKAARAQKEKLQREEAEQQETV